MTGDRTWLLWKVQLGLDYQRGGDLRDPLEHKWAFGIAAEERHLVLPELSRVTEQSEVVSLLQVPEEHVGFIASWDRHHIFPND